MLPAGPRSAHVQTIQVEMDDRGLSGRFLESPCEVDPKISLGDALSAPVAVGHGLMPGCKHLDGFTFPKQGRLGPSCLDAAFRQGPEVCQPQYDQLPGHVVGNTSNQAAQRAASYRYSGIGSPRSTAANIAFTVGRCKTKMVKMPRTVPMGMSKQVMPPTTLQDFQPR